MTTHPVSATLLAVGVLAFAIGVLLQYPPLKDAAIRGAYIQRLGTIAFIAIVVSAVCFMAFGALAFVALFRMMP